MLKRLIVPTATLVFLLPPSAHAAGSVTDSAKGSSQASEGSAAGFETSLVGSLVASEASGQGSILVTHASFDAIASSAELGARFVIAAVRFAGEVAIVSFAAYAAGTSAAAVAGSELLEFSIELSRPAFEASLAASEGVSTAIANGTQVPVVATALSVGSAERIIGYSFALAEDPDVMVGVVLNDVGRQLYAAQIG